MRILVTGGAGFVARNLASAFTASGHHVLALPHEQLHIGNEAQMHQALDGFAPDVVVNAAGRKDLKLCEEHPTETHHTNAFAASLLARICKDRSVKLCHIGSDHAYSTPVTAYGESKRLGDEMVMRSNPAALIAVTGHVYAPDCPWVRWLDGELREGRTVEAWADISNCPTYAPNLAAMILDLLDRGVTGRVSCIGGNGVNRLELFRAYARAAGLDESLVVRCSTLCPSKLHPRLIRNYNPYTGKVRRMTVEEGFAAMFRTVATKEGVAA